MQKAETKNIFKDFTNLYELSKTLRFELKPVGNTQKMLDDNKVFEKDKLIDDNYHKIKYYFDLLHRKFIKESLLEIHFDFNEYHKSFLGLKKGDKKTQDDFKKQEDVLRKKVIENFNKKANEWKKKYKQKGVELKQDGFEIFFEKDNLKILKDEFKSRPNSEEKSPDIEFIDPVENKTKNLFESFAGFATYFSNFNNSRRNFYSAKDKDTAIANRAINENLRRFCDNKKLFDDNKKIYGKIDLTENENKIFELDYYNNCLVQEGINKYNEIIGRKAKDEGGKGLNQKINEYKQKTKEKIYAFKMLDKQILGETEKDSEKFIEITEDKQVFELLNEFIVLNNQKIVQSEKIFNNFLSNQDGYDLDKIYIKKTAINTISRKFFGDNWQYFENALPKKETESKEEKFKLDDFISIQIIKDALLGIQKDKKELPKKYQYLSKIEMLPKDLFKKEHKEMLVGDNYQNFLNIWKSEFKKCLDKYETAKGLTKKMITEEKVYKKSDVQIEKIKAYADASLSIFQMMKYFALEKGRKKIVDLQTDDNFYNSFGEYHNDYRLNDYYNEFRNYLTQKDFLGRLLFPSFSGQDNREEKHPLSKRKIDGAEKISLNFDFSHDHKWGFLAFLFRQNNNKFYIGVSLKGNNLKFKESKKGTFEKMEYVQLKFKTLTGKGYIRDFKTKYSEQEDQEAIANVKILIKKQYLDRYPLLSEVLNKKYSSKKEFGKHVNELLDASYSAKFISISENIFEMNKNGNMFLFMLNNKDFRTTGTPNLHTQYFNLLFKQSSPAVLKLNSEIELFFRPKIKNLSVREKKGKKMIFTDKRDGNKKKKVLQHRRYAEDKIFLHLSIIQNFGKEKIKNDAKAMKSYAKKFNAGINEKILKSNVKIIGIDRGENHLAYYSVLDQTGKIIESESLNKIYLKDKDGNPIFRKDEQGNTIDYIDYLKLLETKAGNRDEARKNWKTIENIKELKNGYISQVVRKICDLILKYNAIVVFEDLSGGFKRSRMKIEQQVYQKLELALVKKLNYLANKNAKENEAGHFLRAYQLTSPVATYGDIGKQTGIIFYTQASYTSKTCPQCGFRKNVGFYFETKQKAEDEIKKIKFFKYEPQKNRFRIEYNLNDFIKEEKKSKKERNNLLFQEEKKKDNFVICSNVIRYKWRDRKINENDLRPGEVVYKTKKENRGTVIEYDITECLIGLFEQNNMSYRDNDLKNAIITNKNLTSEFYKDLFYYLFLISNIRNSISGTDIDYIQCPQCGFNSRNDFQGYKFNGDANGAYNIARKGIMILEKIKQYKKENGNLDKISWGDLVIGIEEWDKFVQQK